MSMAHRRQHADQSKIKAQRLLGRDRQMSACFQNQMKMGWWHIWKTGLETSCIITPLRLVPLLTAASQMTNCLALRALPVTDESEAAHFIELMKAAFMQEVEDKKNRALARIKSRARQTKEPSQVKQPAKRGGAPVDFSRAQEASSKKSRDNLQSTSRRLPKWQVPMWKVGQRASAKPRKWHQHAPYLERKLKPVLASTERQKALKAQKVKPPPAVTDSAGSSAVKDSSAEPFAAEGTQGRRFAKRASQTGPLAGKDSRPAPFAAHDSQADACAATDSQAEICTAGSMQAIHATSTDTQAEPCAALDGCAEAAGAVHSQAVPAAAAVNATFKKGPRTPRAARRCINKQIWQPIFSDASGGGVKTSESGRLDAEPAQQLPAKVT